jgi:hypothetical protein
MAIHQDLLTRLVFEQFLWLRFNHRYYYGKVLSLYQNDVGCYISVANLCAFWLAILVLEFFYYAACDFLKGCPFVTLAIYFAGPDS